METATDTTTQAIRGKYRSRTENKLAAFQLAALLMQRAMTHGKPDMPHTISLAAIDAADWHHGTTLVRDSYFENYARELAEDLHGDRIRSAEWPMNHIDWSAAADSLQQDYTAVEFDGVTYWVR